MEIELVLNGGMVVRGTLSKPDTACAGVVVLIHGLGEHFGRYAGWAGRFLERGFAVAGVDLPGHGISDGKRGHISSYRVADNLIDELVKKAAAECHGVPVVLYGHSLGGGIVLRYLLSRKPGVACAVVTSPWLKLAFEPAALKLILAMAVKKIAPAMVQPSGLNVNYLSRDKRVAAAYTSDPLVHDRISVSLFNEAVSSAACSLKNRHELTIPLLLMHGADDMITSPEGSRLFAEDSPEAFLKIWEGGYHELHNDIIAGEVFEYIAGWLIKTLSD
ncbi:MAG: alpha/beta hydrolase [Bacteroidetes bacterium]|nr:alpha/beta hydrolase [Bacteroidota bacterium]